MVKVTIIDGNDEIELSTAPKENIKAYMVKGEPGSDGVSPTASISKTGDTATITVTDKNGTTEADVVDGFNPTVTASKSNRVTTLTITDIDGTRTAEILDGLDLTGGVPTNGVIGFDTDEIIYTCDGTESGNYYLIYNSISYYFTMPTVEEDDVLVFNTDTLTLTLNNTTISTSSSGSGTELTFSVYIPNGYEVTNEPFPGSGGGSSITVHDSYSTSTTEPYSANYVNGAIPSISDSYSTSTTDGYSANYINNTIKGDLLWTNSDTTSNFTSQNITLSTAANYDIIGVWLYRNTTNAELEEIRIKNGTGGSLIFGELYNNVLYIQGRNFNFTNSTTLNFGGGFLHATNGNTTSNDNSRGIPAYIVGYKMNSFS